MLNSFSVLYISVVCITLNESEPVFVDLSRRPGIDSQPGGPVRQPYFSYRPARLHRLAKSIPRNRFLGSINVYKYGLCSLNSQFCTRSILRPILRPVHCVQTGGNVAPSIFFLLTGTLPLYFLLFLSVYSICM
jgi:hypothetical protein